MLIIAALMAYSEFFFFYSLGASVAKNIYCSVFSEKYKVPKKKIFASQSPYINSSQDTVTMYSRSFYFLMTKSLSGFVHSSVFSSMTFSLEYAGREREDERLTPGSGVRPTQPKQETCGLSSPPHRP